MTVLFCYFDDQKRDSVRETRSVITGLEQEKNGMRTKKILGVIKGLASGDHAGFLPAGLLNCLFSRKIKITLDIFG
jgi:hypothetical protein